jgi:photosystem II stability/assembly factor-like uncharacterized protein
MQARSLLFGSFMLLFASRTALANGRFPRAERLIEDPREPNHLLLAATYGLLTTSDRGKNWDYTCELAFSLVQNYAGDPLLELAEDGSELVGVQTTLNRSIDSGCGWSVALGGSKGNEYIPDYTLTTNSDAKRNAVIVLQAAVEAGKIVTRIVQSPDAGVTFAAPGPALDVASAFTIDAAPSNPEWLYVSALTQAGNGVLLVSVDGGQNFDYRPIPGTSQSDVPYIAAIDPQDQETIYLRTDSKTAVDGHDTANDALLVSHDAGRTWSELYRAHAKLLGFALSPDGRELALGYASSVDSQLAFDADALGIFRSAVADPQFERSYAGPVTCLTWTANGLYACTAQVEQNFALGFVDNTALGQGGPLKLAPLLDLSTVHGPSCCASPQGGLCDAAWLATCFQLGACYTQVDSTAPFTCSGETAEGGNTGVEKPAPAKDSGCSCRTAPAASHDATPLSVLLAASTLLLVNGRRRRLPHP